MKLIVELGFNGLKREVVWWQPLLDFPPILAYGGKKWSWFSYDKDPLGLADFVLMYAEIPTYDPDYSVTGVKLDELTGTGKCECGAMFTSFPWDHMRFCPKWTRW